MTTLKYLKQITFRCSEHRDFCKAVCNEELRQEAIKWIKFFSDGSWQVKGKQVNPKVAFKDKIDWIKHFFNITDKDLNQEGQLK